MAFRRTSWWCQDITGDAQTGLLFLEATGMCVHFSRQITPDAPPHACNATCTLSVFHICPQAVKKTNNKCTVWHSPIYNFSKAQLLCYHFDGSKPCLRGHVKGREYQKGQDLWSHLASNSVTFCSLLLNIRGPQRDKGQGTGARGRMSRLALSPPAKPARLCGTLSPSFDNKGEGSTLARQPPVPGRNPGLPGSFKAALQDHV